MWRSVRYNHLHLRLPTPEADNKVYEHVVNNLKSINIKTY